MTLEIILQFIFWLAVVMLFYAFIGYPILVYTLSLISPKAVKKADFEPTVTILITAYNEERSIGEKIKNTFEIEYPKEKLEILVASDGSTDKTDEIVKQFSDKDKKVALYHESGRRGKTYTQNKAIEKASGEIVVFSDATTKYKRDVLRKILPNFADESIGCVTGKLIYVDNSDSGIGKGARRYWSFETFLKTAESKACSLIGVSGCLYAVRKNAYKPMYPEACSDFLICTILYKQNLRSIYEPEAQCFEETNRDTAKELKMRIRVISQTFTDLWRNLDILNPFKIGFYAIELLSHKLLRYAVPLFLFILLAASVALSSFAYYFTFILIAQLLFYMLALIAFILEKAGFRIGILSLPHYFVVTNIASVIGFYKFLIGEKYASWEPIREVEKINT